MKKFLLSLAVLAASAFTLGAQETLTVADGSNTSSTVPFNMMYWDEANTTTQVIYPESMIEDMYGGQISSMKFYTSGTFTNVAGTAKISVGTTDQNHFETATQITGLTVVNSAWTCPESNVAEVEVVFDEPFTYNGGNLVFECVLTESTGAWKSNNFFGANQDAKVSFSRTTTYSFMPKTTFTYTLELQDYAAALLPSELNFGKVSLGGEKQMTVTLKNKGALAFTPTISGLQAPYSTTYEAAELASKETVEIPVKFAPTALGEYTGTMTIDCGEAGTFEVALSGNSVNEFELTICDGTGTNEYLPIYGTWCDTQGTLGQMLYPAEMLEDLNGAKITGIKFFNSKTATKSYGTIELALKETEETAYVQETAIAKPTNLVTELTTVASTVTAIGDNELAFELAEPFTYNGGNLAVQTLVTTAGGWENTAFYGTAMTANTGYTQWTKYSGDELHISQFLPKMTIIYTKAEPVVETVTVTGTVTDQSTEETIEGVTVTLTVNAPAKEGEATTYTATTNAEGVYTMEVTPVEGATYDMTFEKEGYVAKTIENVSLEEPQNVSLNQTTITGISDVNVNNAVSVKYINAMGQVSNRPFEGINIVVTRNADGSTTTTKVVK